MLTGFGFMVQMAAGNTLLQTVVDEDKRGRVMKLSVVVDGSHGNDAVRQPRWRGRRQAASGLPTR